MNEAIKKKYCHLFMFDISEPGQVIDSDNNGNSSNGSSQSSPATAADSQTNKSTKQLKCRANKKSKRPPRPPNAFILYRKAKHPDIVAQNKYLTNAEISKVISKMWWKESEEEKFQWEKRADRMKLKHKQDYPDYVYQPKKPAAKKRKSTQCDGVNLSTSFPYKSAKKRQNNSTLPDETITAIAEVAFAVGHKYNQTSLSPVSSIPSSPLSVDKPLTNSSSQSPPQGILHNHRPNHRASSINHVTLHHHHYAVFSPTQTEIYDITPQFQSDNISHGNFTPQQPIEVTSYISPHALTNNDLDFFLDAQPYFINQDPSTMHASYSFNNFDTDTTLM